MTPQCYHSGNLHVQRVLSCSLGAGHGTAGLFGGLVGAGKAGPRAAIDSEKEGPGDVCLPGRISVSTARFQEYEPAQPRKQNVFVDNNLRQMPLARKQPVPVRQEALNK